MEPKESRGGGVRDGARVASGGGIRSGVRMESGWGQGGVMGRAIVESGGVGEEPRWSRVESSGDRVELGWILG